MRKARKSGKQVKIEERIEIPFIQCNGFYNTVEGCTISWLSKEIRDKAQKAFGELPDAEKNRLSFAPKNGEFVERVLFWKRLFKPVMNPKQLHIVMRRILHWYIHIKQMDKEE